MNGAIRIILLALVLLAGCTGNISRGFYEGIKSQKDATRSPNERAMEPVPSYDTYTKEREKL